MSHYISKMIREEVAERANHRCEYCRIYARHSFLSFHVEHIISLKHDGTSTIDNLAYACPICNINKGTDIATILTSVDELIRFYNPRKDYWEKHFSIEDSGIILPKTLIGEATIKIFDLNHLDSIIERSIMIQMNIF